MKTIKKFGFAEWMATGIIACFVLAVIVCCMLSMSYAGVSGGGGSGSGATAFTGLSDVPASYSGQTGKTLTVNGGETGLQFSTAGNGDMTKAVDGANIATSTTIIRQPPPPPPSPIATP